MTTASIANQGSTETKARVALISKSSSKGDVAATVARSGHEVVEFDDWDAFLTAAVESTMDLILFDHELAVGLPDDLTVPSVQVGDRAAAPTSSLGCLPTSAFAAALEPLLRIANELRSTMVRCRELEHLVGGVRNGSALVGHSVVMRRLHTALSRAADTDATVLIEGPRGAGKSLAARVIHCKSRRSDRRLEVVACEQQDADSLTQVLAAARGTTLVLEDIDRLPPAAQSVLVRHLKERNASQLHVAPRLISTTAAHLPELVAKGAFREDLYYRLHALPIVVPALRERPEDVGLIAHAILDTTVPAGRGHSGLTAAALTQLEGMQWPGNVAQLELVVRRAQALAGGAAVDCEHLVAAPPVASATTANGPALSPRRTDDAEVAVDEDSIRPFDEEEQLILSRALRATKGNVRRAAQLLGIGRATLYRKIQQYKLRLQ